jgi:hypothetical protein
MRQREEYGFGCCVGRCVMGGRGAASYGAGLLPADVLENLPYNLTSFDE